MTRPVGDESVAAPSAGAASSDIWEARLPRKLAPYLIGIVVALFLPRLLNLGMFAVGQQGIRVSWISGPRSTWITSPLTVAALILIVLRVERLPLRTLFPGRFSLRLLGLVLVFAVVTRTVGPVPLIAAAFFLPRRPNRRGRALAVWATWFVVVCLAGTWLFGLAVDAYSLGQAAQGNQGLAIIAELSVLEKLVLVFVAASAEELRYRAYLIERLHGLGLSPALAVLVSYLLFVAAHIPFFGLEHVLRITAIGSVAFAVLYYMTRSVWACFALHALFGLGILLV